jgi:hypothetical protein
MENNKKYSTPSKNTPSKSIIHDSYNDDYRLKIIDSILNYKLDISREEVEDIIQKYIRDQNGSCTKHYK